MSLASLWLRRTREDYTRHAHIICVVPHIHDEVRYCDTTHEDNVIPANVVFCKWEDMPLKHPSCAVCNSFARWWKANVGFVGSSYQKVDIVRLTVKYRIVLA